MNRKCTAPTHAQIARTYLLLGLCFGYSGYQLSRSLPRTYGDVFFLPAVGLMLAAMMLVCFWVTEKLVQFLNHAGRASAAYAMLERERYDGEAPALWTGILGPDAMEKRRKETEAKRKGVSV